MRVAGNAPLFHALSKLFTCFICFALALLSAAPAAAQDLIIQGTVRDKSTGDALPGAYILSGKTQTVSAADGSYRLALSDAERVEVQCSFIGYARETATIRPLGRNPYTLDFELSADVQALGIAVVSASQYARELPTETVSMAVVSAAFVENTNAQDLGEAVKRVPGVIIQDSQISIRGGNSYSYGIGSRTAVLVDGLSIMSADLGEAQLSLIPIENIGQIEVIKGASSVVYGSSALNGVVNVITRWPSAGDPELRLSAFGMAYDETPRPYQRWHTTDDGARGARGFSGNYGVSKKQNDLVIGGNLYQHKSFLQANDTFRGRMHVKTRRRSKANDRLTYGLNANVMYDETDRFFLASGLDSNAFRVSATSEDHYLRATFDPHLNYTTEKGNQHVVDARWLHLRRFGNGADIDAISNQATANYRYQHRLSKAINGKRFIERRIVLTPGLNTNFGYNVSNLYPEKHYNYFGALYTQAEVQFDRRSRTAMKQPAAEPAAATGGAVRTLSLSGGLRYEVNGIDQFVETNIPVFRSGINVQVGKASYVRASVGQSYRIPTIGERFLTADLLGLAVIPNQNLAPERGWCSEVGVSQGFGLGSWRGFVDVTYFHQQYTDFVEYRVYSTATRPELFEGINSVVGFYPENVDEATINGIELTVQGSGKLGAFQVTPQLGYTYIMPVNTVAFDATGAEMQDVFFRFFNQRMTPETGSNYLLFMRMRHLINGDIQVDHKRWGAGASVYYGSFPELFQPEFEGAVDLLSIDGSTLASYGAERLGGDWVFDARVNYRAGERFALNFVVKNITNRLYAMRPSRPEPIRNFTFQVNYTFN